MEEKRYRKISEYLWQIILIVIGILFVIISFFVDDNASRWFSTLNGVGVSLVLSGLIGIFMNALFYRKDARYEVCEEWKIEKIYMSRAISNLTADVYQQDVKHQIDIIAFGLSSWRQANEKLIDSALARGVKIRIITVHPDNPILDMRDQAEGKKAGSTRESILQLREFFKQTNRRSRVEIKYHQELPLDFYFRIDDHIFVGPYLFGKDSQQMITYEFTKGGKGFNYYKDYFDSLWNQKTIPKVTFKDFFENG